MFRCRSWETNIRDPETFLFLYFNTFRSILPIILLLILRYIFHYITTIHYGAIHFMHFIPRVYFLMIYQRLLSLEVVLHVQATKFWRMLLSQTSTPVTIVLLLLVNRTR